MEHRGPYVYTDDGRIVCEINHPKFGWIPCTIDENDPPTQDIFNDVVANETIEPYEG